MAFKRYAALLAGSALAGSALFAQPAMAEEPAEFSYTPVTVEKGQQADSEAPSGANVCTRILPVNSNKELAEKLGANVDIKTGVVTFDQTELKPLPETGEYDLQIACAIDAEGGKTDWKTAPIKVTVEEKDGEGGENDEGGNDGENGEGGNDGDTVITQTIADVKVTEGESKTVDLELKGGVTKLEFTETGDLEIEFKDGKLTVDAKDAEANEYTVKFTYKANDEDKEGTFKVTVEEKKEEPKENASSKASSNFLSSFKGLSSK